jgi:hypothetical protein
MMFESESSEEDTPQEFISNDKTVLYCNPGRFDSTEGARNTIITVMGNRSGDVENVAISLDDSRKLAVALLVSLCTADDPFASRILDYFPYDEDGRWHWPKTDLE